MYMMRVELSSISIHANHVHEGTLKVVDNGVSTSIFEPWSLSGYQPRMMRLATCATSHTPRYYVSSNISPKDLP